MIDIPAHECEYFYTRIHKDDKFYLHKTSRDFKEVYESHIFMSAELLDQFKLRMHIPKKVNDRKIKLDKIMSIFNMNDAEKVDLKCACENCYKEDYPEYKEYYIPFNIFPIPCIKESLKES